MGCCCCSSRATSIFAAIFSLLQGSAWLGLAISGLLLYNCNTTLDYGDLTVSGDAISVITGFIMNMLTLAYFYNNDCPGNIRPNFTVSAPGQNRTVIWLNGTVAATDRTYSWMLAYIILSSLWIATSILLLIVAVSNKKGATAGRLHYPWLLVMAAIIVADVVATIIYCLDIPQTMGLKNFLEFAGADPSSVTNLPIEFATRIISAVPSIAMGVMFCRFFVIWIANLSLFGMVFSSARKIGKVKKTPARTTDALGENNPNPWARSLQSAPGAYPPPTNIQQSPQQRQLQRYHDPDTFNNTPPPTNIQQSPHQRQLQRYHDPDTFNNTPPPTPPKPNRNSMQQYPPHQPYINPQQYPQQYSQQPNQNFQPYQNPPPAQYQQNPVPHGSYQQNSLPPGKNPHTPQSYYNEGYQNSEPVNHRSSPDHRYQEVKPHMLLQKEPSLKGPPTAPKPTPSSPLARSDSRTTNTELRSQLPWSYVQHRDEQLPIKVQQKIDEDDEDAPPIPIPDYTLHFPRRPRGDQPKFPAAKPTAPSRPPHNADKSRGYNDVLY